MGRIILTAALGVAAACITGGCANSGRQPTSIAGAITQSGAPAPSPGTGGSPGAAGASGNTGNAGNAGLSSDRLNAAITAATADATTLHVTGTLTTIQTPLTLDTYLDKSGTASGTLDYEGASIPFTVVGGVDYFQLTPSLMTLTKITDPSAKDKWVTSASSYGEPLVTLFGQFINLNSFLTHGLAGTGDTFTYKGLRKLGSQQVAVYQESGSEGETFDYDFPLTGAALALEFSGGDSDASADLDYTWNQPTPTTTAPSASEIYGAAK